MNKSGKLAAFVSLATIFMVSCLEPEKIIGLVEEPDSSSSVDISSSSAEVVSWLTCDGKEYNPDTEICLSPFVICQNQITNCGGCKEYTDCQGNSIGQMLCIAADLNCFNPPVMSQPYDK